MKYAALLRGVNVGGNNKLPMADLREALTKAGWKQVSTYIQSGNVMFEAAQTAPATLAARLTADIEKHFGFKVPAVVVSLAELKAAVMENPFPDAAARPKQLHILFLADAPANGDSLEQSRVAPGRFALQGRMLYVDYVEGLADSKFTNTYVDSRLKTLSTGRNWNTILKLIELLEV